MRVRSQLTGTAPRSLMWLPANGLWESYRGCDLGRSKAVRHPSIAQGAASRIRPCTGAQIAIGSEAISERLCAWKPWVAGAASLRDYVSPKVAKGPRKLTLASRITMAKVSYLAPPRTYIFGNLRAPIPHK